MEDIGALESRILAALDRIGTAAGAKGGGDEQAALSKALAHEQAKNVELIDSARALKDRLDAEIAQLTDKLAAQTAQIEQLDTDLQRLRASNTQLREMNADMRQAITTGKFPEVADAAKDAEIAALAAQRAADAAEIEAVLGQLTPLLEEAAHAPG
ncbi:hypothetical protein [Yoonia sp. SS1-5]|uniref:Colicin transporter n=1 Tax=Yoonia rhodophyticola TaxID=3137370 RepID=A0AAN0NLA6_9RHOB